MYINHVPEQSAVMQCTHLQRHSVSKRQYRYERHHRRRMVQRFLEHIDAVSRP